MLATILVIEDDWDILKTFIDCLSEEGYRVLFADNGETGVELVERYSPDLVICDIIMPGMDGHEVLEFVRSRPTLQPIPFIFATAKAEYGDLRMGMNLGADDYITKPFEIDELLQVVKTRLRRARAFRAQSEAQLELVRSGLSVSLAHELRTPITCLFMLTELMLEELNDTGVKAGNIAPDTLRDHLEGIRESGARLHRLSESFLYYCFLTGEGKLKLESARIEDIAESVRRAATHAAARYDRVHDLHLELEASISAAFPEPYLEKIVCELVDNALKFSADGKKVYVQVEHSQGSLVLSVRDTGRGMTKSELEQLGAFVQFERAIHEQQGVGLGLAVCQRLVEAAGGRITVESSPNEGTEVRVVLIPR